MSEFKYYFSINLPSRYITQQFIARNFENLLKDATTILQNNITFFNEQVLGETILKQTLVKGTFPRLSYERGLIEREMKHIISDKIKVEAPTQKTDFRLIGEILSSNILSKTSASIQRIIMNFEDPKKIRIITNRNNLNKDVTLDLRINNNLFSREFDIKAGNNAVNPFSGIIAAVPYTETLENYTVINKKVISLPYIQEIRLEQFRKLKAENDLLTETFKQIEYFNNLPLDSIQKNILIQEEIFKALSLSAKIGSPFVYAAYIVPYANILHEKFFEKLHSNITVNIFNNKDTFKNYMIHALTVYNEDVSEIAKNIKENKRLLRESGISEITDEIFN